MSLFVSLGVVSSLWGEETPERFAETWNLEQVMRQALDQNPELQDAEAAVAAARGERRAAGQWKNPEITAEYGEKRVSHGAGVLDAKGNAQRYGFQQTFEFLGKASLRKAIADRNIRLAELALEQMRQSVATRARILAVQWVAADREAIATEDVADRSDTLVEMLSGRAITGVQSLLDQKIIEASMVNLRTMAREALERRDEARIALNMLCGRSANDPLEVKMPLRPPASPGDWKSLYEKTQETNLDLKSREVEIERAEKTLGQARLGAAPDITVGPFLSKENAPEQESVIGMGISFPLPLWDSHRGQTDVARAALSSARARQAQTRRETEHELARAYAAYTRAVEQLQKTPPRQLEKLAHAAELADRHYRLGVISVQTYIEMQDQYLGAVRGILGAFQEAYEHLFEMQLLSADSALRGISERFNDGKGER